MSKLAWRWWDIGKNHDLQSVNHIIWAPDTELKASCLYFEDARGNAIEGHNPPEQDCGCGFWGFTDPDIAEGLIHQSTYFRTCKVFGVIEGWGGTVPHQYGWRFEYCTIRALCVNRGRLHPCYREVIPHYRTNAEMIRAWDAE